jgi:hypothetical protein
MALQHVGVDERRLSMMMGGRFAAWRIAHDDGNHALALGVQDYMLEDGFHLLQILRKPGRYP